jgi:hypothetical protein
MLRLKIGNLGGLRVIDIVWFCLIFFLGYVELRGVFFYGGKFSSAAVTVDYHGYRVCGLHDHGQDKFK